MIMKLKDQEKIGDRIEKLINTAPIGYGEISIEFTSDGEFCEDWHVGIVKNWNAERIWFEGYGRKNLIEALDKAIEWRNK